jgi:hypothetical protein
VYLFGDTLITDTNNNNVPATYLARVPTTNVESISSWTFWNGSSWDTQETNAAVVINNSVDNVRLYKGNWVAVSKPYGTIGNTTYAYVASKPQGPYSSQFLFGDPTNDIQGIGTTTNQATSVLEYYYSASPAVHPEYSLTSSNLLVSIGYEDANSYQYYIPDAQLYKPRFYEVTLTNLVSSSVITIQTIAGNVVLTWPSGTLLEATNLIGPWAINLANSPYTNSPSAAQKFYRTIQ